MVINILKYYIRLNKIDNIFISDLTIYLHIMDKLPRNYKYLPKVVWTALILEILASLVIFMIGRIWNNQIVYVPLSQYVPVSQYGATKIKVNINHLWTHNNQVQLISSQVRSNTSKPSKGFHGKYNRISSSQNVYFPGDPLPQKQLDIIRKSSDTTLKRRNMLADAVNIFKINDIRYTLTNYHLH